jgi:hypothetical protein
MFDRVTTPPRARTKVGKSSRQKVRAVCQWYACINAVCMRHCCVHASLLCACVTAVCMCHCCVHASLLRACVTAVCMRHCCVRSSECTSLEVAMTTWGPSNGAPSPPWTLAVQGTHAQASIILHMRAAVCPMISCYHH